jgi:hypothetical protein
VTFFDGELVEAGEAGCVWSRWHERR